MKRGQVATALVGIGALVLVTLVVPWFGGPISSPGTGAQLITVGGGAFPAVGAAALVVVASGIALVLAGPRLARAIGAIATLAGLGGAAFVILTALDPDRYLDGPAIAATGIPFQGGVIETLPAVWVAAILFAGAAAMGLLTILRARTFAIQRSRFETKAAWETSDPRLRAMDDWDAFSRGEDPSE